MHHHAYKIYYCQMRGIKYVKDILHAHFAAKAAVYIALAKPPKKANTTAPAATYMRRRKALS